MGRGWCASAASELDVESHLPLDVYRAVEETDDVHVFDIHHNPSDSCIVGRNIRPVLNGMFREAEQTVERKLAGTTLADCIAQMRAHIDAQTPEQKGDFR